MKFTTPTRSYGDRCEMVERARAQHVESEVVRLEHARRRVRDARVDELVLHPGLDVDVDVRDVHRLQRRRRRRRRVLIRAILYERTSGWSSKASEAELKGVEDGD